MFLPLLVFLGALPVSLWAPVPGAGLAAPAFDPDSVPDAYSKPLGALMWPGATRAFQVDPAGDLYNGAWVVRLTATESGAPVAAPRHIASEDRWRPVLRWRRHGPNTVWDFEAVACPEPATILESAARAAAQWQEARLAREERRVEEQSLAGLPLARLDERVVRASRRLDPRPEERVNLLVSLEATVTNSSPAPVWVSLEPAFAPSDSARAYSDRTVPIGEAPPAGWAGSTGTAIAYCEGAARDGGTRASGRLAVRLATGESRRVRFAFPAYPVSAARLAEWTRVPHAQRVAETRRYWDREVARGMRLDLGDREVEDAVRAARVVLLACRERRNGLEVPLGGPFHYRDVWLRDGARHVQALALHGYAREARRLGTSFEAWQWPHGPFVSQGAQLDGTGQAMWALGEVMLRPAPGVGTARTAAAAERAWRWCERQRAARDAATRPMPGMLPFADPHDNELIRAQLVGNDAWAIAGYRSAARMLRAAGRPADAERVERSRARYVREFSAALEKSGSADIPPAWTPGGYDWGNLAAAWPCGAISAADPRAAALARRYWARAGGAGLGFYGTPSSLHAYVAADLGTWALLAGDPLQADSVLTALLRWRNGSGGAGELFARDGDYGVNLPPHSTSAAALLALTRNQLVFDDRDTLDLTLGPRAAWWRRARVRDAPTRWGTIALEFDRAGDQAHWRWTPVPVWTSLTLPAGTRLAGNPPLPLRSDGARRILAPPGTGEASVRIREIPDPRRVAGAPWPPRNLRP